MELRPPCLGEQWGTPEAVRVAGGPRGSPPGCHVQPAEGLVGMHGVDVGGQMSPPDPV